ncbi:uncharacterized protein HD556DRAFT_1454633 [Suillus plorans]|uniref:G domain-containing protein n=1 Tax=Suillus plorans TaxID=116603 RepID=A0A9P7JA21_9AGAM|nr:uncharacterized protein HD556DRAFT_1454633 [Suillus plorans]KAG1810483.1 hypothetical protein HD556DRAFT_1454633 [Suillus plorans]
MANALHPLHIHGITVDFSKLKTNVESAEVRIGKFNSPIKREEGKSLCETFSPPIMFSRGNIFSLRMQYKGRFVMKTKDITFDPNDTFLVSSGQEYIKWYKKIRVVVDLSGDTSTKAVSSGQSSGLLPTTADIFESCPRFRILVIGKTGVGKSSLIDHVFGVGEQQIIEHNKPGEAIINKEFTSPENDRFVLHDSKGFEPGEVENLTIVQKIIERRRNMPDLKDQLHAVWLCFQIPRAGRCLLETGTEEFLELKRNGTLGNVPIIVVLTKYDMLIEHVERNLDEASLDESSDEAFEELVKSTAKAEVQDTCIGPLEEFSGSDIPHATISTAKGYEETLTHLIEITESCVNQHLAPEAAVMTSVAQRVHPGLKIDALIKIGKQRYWKALTSCPMFKKHQMQDCLRVLHNDIIEVWNFRDSHHYLRSQEFRDLMMKMADKTQAGSTANPNTTLKFGLSMVGTIAGIVSALAGPAAPIVVPIAAGAVVVVWVREVYKMSHVVLQRFMAYIMHLTLVLQTLFIVSESQELTRRAIKLAVKSYVASSISEEVLTRIQDYVGGLAVLEHADKDTLDKIEEMMQFYKIDGAQITELAAQMSNLQTNIYLLPDEPW